MTHQLGIFCTSTVALLLAVSAGPGACGPAGGPAVPDTTQARVPDGQWGGNGALLTVEGASATIQFDCAEGTLNGPLTIDDRRRFAVEGSFVRGRGGPVPEDPPPPEPAKYSGQLTRDTLALTVRVGDEEFGTFTLTRGRTARLRRCL
jgi:hypothetical protein